MIERLFSETQYYAAYQSGLKRIPLPNMQPTVRIFPRLYHSKYRYTLTDLVFAHKEGMNRRPPPGKKIWK